MIFKSRQINHDPKPWVAYPSAESGLPSFRATSLEVIDAMPHREKFEILTEYSPRPEFEPTRDKRPWRNIYDGSRWEDNWSDWEGLEWAPRTEQFDTPVNKVLEQVRLQATRTGDFPTVAKNILSALEQGERSLQVRLLKWTPDEADHARKVLARLGCC